MTDQGASSQPSRITLLSVLEQYSQAKSHRPDTVHHYFTQVKRLEKDTGIRFLDQISFDLLLDWRRQIIDRSSPTNWNNYHRHMRALLNYCVEQGLIPENPLTKIKQSNRANTRRERCSIDDLQQCINFLENEIGDPELSTFTMNMLLVVYFTGIRRSQLVGLVWSDINFDDDTILLRKMHSKTAHQWTIPMHPDLRPPLSLMKSDIRQKVGQAFSEDDQVFLIQRYSNKFAGERMKPMQVTGIFQRLARKTKTRIGLHSIRHLVATQLANQFSRNPHSAHSSLVHIRDLLGHGDIKTTVGYIETDMSTQRQLIEGLNNISFKGKPHRSDTHRSDP